MITSAFLFAVTIVIVGVISFFPDASSLPQGITDFFAQAASIATNANAFFPMDAVAVALAFAITLEGAIVSVKITMRIIAWWRG